MLPLILMIISEILLFGLGLVLRKEKKSQLKNAFYFLLICLFIWTLCSMLQFIFQDSDIDPFLWEKLASFAVCFAPVALFSLSQTFAKTKINIKWYHLLFLVIPIMSIIMIFTNEYHHLYFKQYSLNADEIVIGNYYPIHNTYTYLLYGISIYYLIKYSIKNAGFFSKQSVLILLGISVPLAVNTLGAMGIIEITTYMTSMSFSILAFFFAIAIFKFKFISITPIAMQNIVDRMSDSFVVINENNNITDFNKTFTDTFKLSSNKVRNTNIIDLLKKDIKFEDDIRNIENAIKKARMTAEIIYFDKEFKIGKQYFSIEVSNISSNKNYLGTLILFKDVTQHIEDMKTIKNNQDMLMERERLASLGQLIGGIAHNLKTPIMSISGASEGLSDLIKEYEISVGDAEVTVEDHHEIAKDMKDWISKIRSYTEYMSDVITAVKGQAVTLSEEQVVSFNLDELVKRVDILMRHELKNALINLNNKMEIDPNIELKGNINSLVQVINNMISNAIQAYNGKPNEQIDLIISQADNNVIISVVDHAGGLPKEVEGKLFKEMITTKGKNGTGLGLFMSYSTIRAHFNGNITYETKKGEGTAFHIILPMQ